jgi:hypothetical protein
MQTQPRRSISTLSPAQAARNREDHKARLRAIERRRKADARAIRRELLGAAQYVRL